MTSRAGVELPLFQRRHRKFLLIIILPTRRHWLCCRCPSYLSHLFNSTTRPCLGHQLWKRDFQAYPYMKLSKLHSQTTHIARDKLALFFHLFSYLWRGTQRVQRNMVLINCPVHVWNAQLEDTRHNRIKYHQSARRSVHTAKKRNLGYLVAYALDARTLSTLYWLLSSYRCL